MFGPYLGTVPDIQCPQILFKQNLLKMHIKNVELFKILSNTYNTVGSKYLRAISNVIQINMNFRIFYSILVVVPLLLSWQQHKSCFCFHFFQNPKTLFPGLNQILNSILSMWSQTFGCHYVWQYKCQYKCLPSMKYVITNLHKCKEDFCGGSCGQPLSTANKYMEMISQAVNVCWVGVYS